MKWFLIFLAIGLTGSEKLDRSYLPPPGAQFAGGNPGDIQAPLEFSNLQETLPIIPPRSGGLQDFESIGQPKQGPVTTTSYAFTQTTTYPPIENYETTALPLNPVTGSVQNVGQPNYQQFNQNEPSYGQNQAQKLPNYGFNEQPVFGSQVPASDGQPINVGSPNYSQYENQPLNPYPTQNVVNSGRDNLIPGLGSQISGINQGLPTSQNPNQYLGQNIAQPSPGGTIQIPGPGVQIPGINLPSNQYVHDHIVPEQQASLPPQYDQSNQDQQISQQLFGNQNIGSPGSIAGSNIYKHRPDQNGIFSTTATPIFPSSTSAYSSVSPISRPERPQAAADRNAVILTYENERSPNSYAYSFDTSNGIHADETGTVGDGTRAQGSYSYTGDDGKVYSVIYTADENGFQPRGDHLPTPPPIPEAIQKVIEQAVRDKEAGIIDDGSYDEGKYGYKNYEGLMNHLRPQISAKTKLSNKQYNEAQIKPISGITDVEHNERIPLDQLNKNAIGGTGTRPITKYPQGLYYEDDINENISSEIYDDDETPTTGLDDNDGGLKTQGSSVQYPVSEFDTSLKAGDDNLQNKLSLNNQQPTEYHKFSRVKDTVIKYPGSVIEDVNDEDNINHPDHVDRSKSQFEDEHKGDIGIDNSDLYRPSQSAVSSSKGTPVVANRKRIFKQKPEGNRRPGTLNTNFSEENVPQEDFNDFQKNKTEVLSITNYGLNGANQNNPTQESIQKVDDSGYYYNPPQMQFHQTEFPTRFRGQEMTSTSKPVKYEMFDKGSSVKPFLTPEVYNQPSRSRPGSRKPSTTRKPFMTSRVTTPKTSYTDYDDGEDYPVDQDVYNKENEDVYNKENDYNVVPGEKVNIGLRNPSKPTQTTSRPQYGPSSHKARVSQGQRLTPAHKTQYSGTVPPSFRQDFSTSTPVQNSRFGSTKGPRRRIKPQHQRRPTKKPKLPGSSRPVSSQNIHLEIPNRNKATTPASQYFSTTGSPSYLSTEMPSDFSSHLPTGQRVTSAQIYPTSTYRPTTTTTSRLSSGFQPNSGAITTRIYQPTPTGNYQTGYQYGPVNPTTASPQRPTSGQFIPQKSPTASPGYYQTTYEQGPNDYVNNATKISGKPGTFILAGPEIKTPESSPIGTYHDGYNYGPSTPDYASTIVSSTPAPRPNLGSPDVSGSLGSYTSPSGYEYGPTGPVYSTTVSPSTIGTTFSTFVPSSTPGYIPQDFSTTQRPYSTTQGQDVYGPNPVVDGFGRPIISEQQPRYSLAGQKPSQYFGPQYTEEELRRPDGLSNGPSSSPLAVKPGDDLSLTNGGEQYPSYSGPKIIGEDFSGPKQPQRFDPQTGYHYK